MNKYGHVSVCAASPIVYVGDVIANVGEHEKWLDYCKDCDVIVFPELSLTGYTCADLFGQRALLNKALAGLHAIVKVTEAIHPLVAVGLPFYVAERGATFNCAAVCYRGRVLGLVPKTYLPNYKEFYDARWFSAANETLPKTVILYTDGGVVPFGTDLLFRAVLAPLSDNYLIHDYIVSFEICEDAWAPIAPSAFQALAGATIQCNLSASNELVEKADYRRALVLGHSARNVSAYVYCSSGPTESTSGLVFGGHNIIAENGILLKESARFVMGGCSVTAAIDVDKLAHDRAVMPGTFTECARRNHKDYRYIRFAIPGETQPSLNRRESRHPFVPTGKQLDERCKEIFGIQTCALAKRLDMLQSKDVYIGVSGGLDSTLALLVVVRTFDMMNWDRSHIHGIMLPGFGTTRRTRINAAKLLKALKVSYETIDIRTLALSVFRKIGHTPFSKMLPRKVRDDYVTASNSGPLVSACDLDMLTKEFCGLGDDLVFENVQARLRTLILMSRGFVVGTGDLSEIALGWCTYNGDQQSMYNVNCSVPKTLVKWLVKYLAEHQFDGPVVGPVLQDIVDTVISPELLPAKGKSKQQSTEDKIGPYELHDFFLYHFIRNGYTKDKIRYLAERAFQGRYSSDTVRCWLAVFIKRFFANQFKRQTMPDGPKVGSIGLDPRGDWRMPSDAEVNLWLEELKDENA